MRPSRSGTFNQLCLLQLSDMGKELFVGTFVHSLSLENLEIGENGAIGVEDGRIVFVEKNVTDVEAVKKAHGFERAKVKIDANKKTDRADYIVDGTAIPHSWIY